MKDRIAKLQNIIKINFTNIKLLEKSLIHKSFDNKINNEKLEFLGDRVLGLVISKILIETYPDEKEGIIDKKFANLVNKNTCAIIAEKIKLKNYMILGDTYKIVKKSYQKITSDGLEALIGAIYLDKGLKVSEKFISNYWKEYLDKSEFTLIDAKTKLQELALKNFKKLPTYRLISNTGPRHKPSFKIGVKLPDTKYFFGIGNSKKDAEQNAAIECLKSIR